MALTIRIINFHRGKIKIFSNGDFLPMNALELFFDSVTHDQFKQEIYSLLAYYYVGKILLITRIPIISIQPIGSIQEYNDIYCS